MKKFTSTLLVLLGIVLGSASFAAKTDGKDVLVKSTDSGKVELTYLSEGKCRVKVNIYDQSGSKVFADAISNPQSFKKSYDLSKLPAGQYEFEIIDSKKVVVEKVEIADVATSSKILKATVLKENDDKFKVLVHGKIADPVAVNIYDKQGKLVYGDFIDHTTSFTKVYDLSKSVKKDVRFEITQNGAVLAEASF